MSFVPPIGDATTTTKGIVKLSGDLAGTASSPTVPGLSSKLDSSQKGAASGVASLDSSSKVIASQIPVLTLATAPPGARFACPWNSSTTKWAYNGVDLNARPSSRTDIFFVLTGAPASATDPAWAIAGDKREDVSS